MRNRIARQIALGLLPSLMLWAAQPSLGGTGETPTPTASPTPTATPEMLPTCATIPPGVSCCIAGTVGEMCIVGTTGESCPEPPLPTCSSCGGDCNADGMVTVDELVRGVSIGLSSQPLSVCPVMDSNGDGEVTVDELVKAVNNALNGCPVA